MDVPKILKTIGEQITAFASGKLAFGEAITVADRTVIPVAWVRYDFGAGGSTPGVYRRLAKQAGGGGGGQVSVIPAGMIEITPRATRFIPIPDGEKIFALAASSSGTHDGGAHSSETDASGGAKKPTKKQSAMYKSSNLKAAGQPSAKRTPAKTTAKKAGSKTSRSLSQKAVPAKAASKKKSATVGSTKAARNGR